VVAEAVDREPVSARPFAETGKKYRVNELYEPAASFSEPGKLEPAHLAGGHGEFAVLQMGHTRKSADVCDTTASLPEADLTGSPRDVAEGPKTDIYVSVTARFLNPGRSRRVRY